jgi:hypothetical protein
MGVLKCVLLGVIFWGENHQISPKIQGQPTVSLNFKGET